MINITKYKDHKDATLCVWKYWHLIQFEDGCEYGLNTTDECMDRLIAKLRVGNNVNFEII